ncbi:MAG: ATP-binding protein [Coriobacteriia bacterium]|nr:ATP-binding protein [Coriobacteriia bacterium]
MLVGREHEVRELNRLFESGEAELVAIYGRRRVGKTYLVDETFSGHITFRHAGLSPADGMTGTSLRVQLEHFAQSLELQGAEVPRRPESWLEAFFLLEKHLQKIDNGKRQVVFLDELPWLDTPRSGFLGAFEAFWNGWGCHRRNLMVIVCGSATSWVLDRLVNNHGGLYNRLTYEIKLAPFNLRECEQLLDSRHVNLSRYDIAQAYMVFGGIPYYLGYLEGSSSLAQNIDTIVFARGAKLRNEFDRLFDSVFTNPEAEKAIVRFLYTRRRGYKRAEIADGLGISDGGRFSRNLKALIASDFVERYVPFGYGAREEHYRLIDPFCLFYLHFVDGARGLSDRYWQERIDAQPVVTWRGLAFENLCFNHVEQIKAALGVSGVRTTCSAWQVRDGERGGAQIDLLLQRGDNVVNACECKFYSGEFAVDKSYYQVLLGRQQQLAEKLPRKMSVQPTLITTFGLGQNQYRWAFANIITLDDLFV